MQRRYPFRLIAILSQALLSQIVEPDLLLAYLLVDELVVEVDPPSSHLAPPLTYVVGHVLCHPEKIGAGLYEALSRIPPPPRWVCRHTGGGVHHQFQGPYRAD